MKKLGLILLVVCSSILCYGQESQKLTVFFKYNEFTLGKEYKSKIDSLLSKNNNIKKISIEAYCDSIGSNSYNDTLSWKRAKEVEKYIASKKINIGSISTNWNGKRAPLNKNTTRADRALNRRAEIIIENNSNSKKPGNLLLNNIEKVSVGETIRLKNINFEGGSHKILETSKDALENLLYTLKTHPTLTIEIQGHLCCTTHQEDAMDYDTRTRNLSANRAKAVYDYLVENGINPERLSYKGFGGTRKIITEEETEEDKTTNRRVEIMITHK